ALAAQAAHRQPLDREPFGGHHARLEAVARAEPDHTVRAGAQQPREGESGKHMPARATGHDEHRAAHAAAVRRPERGLAAPRVTAVASWNTRSTMPTQASATSRLLRP